MNIKICAHKSMNMFRMKNMYHISKRIPKAYCIFFLKLALLEVMNLSWIKRVEMYFSLGRSHLDLSASKLSGPTQWIYDSVMPEILSI